MRFPGRVAVAAIIGRADRGSSFFFWPKTNAEPVPEIPRKAQLL